MKRTHGINWRREAIYPAQALAEACLIAPWLLLFISLSITVQAESVTAVCLAVILGTLYLAQMMDALKINTWIQRGVILLGILSLSALTLRVLVLSQPMWADQDWPNALTHPSVLINLLPGAVLILLSVNWLCWRGLRLASQPASVQDAMSGFQIGIIILALFAVASSASTAMIFVPAFFFSQLLTVGLTRVESASWVSSGRRLPFSGWWLAVLVGSTGTLVILASMIVAVVLGVGIDKLFFWLGPALAIIAVPFALILTPLMALLEWLMRALQRSLQPVVLEIMNLIEQVQNWLSQVARHPSPVVTALLHMLGYVAIAAIILAVLYVLVVVVLKVGQRRKSQEGDEDELSESVWSGQALLQKLRAQLRRRLARLRNLADIVGRFGAGGLFTALTIRRIYAQMVRLATSRGFPRPVAHTPYEHLATLHQAFPGCEADLAQITEAYVRVHYGELPEEPDALEVIRAAFERIKASDRQSGKETQRPIDRSLGTE